jgi:hypothetical protein
VYVLNVIIILTGWKNDSQVALPCHAIGRLVECPHAAEFLQFHNRLPSDNFCFHQNKGGGQSMARWEMKKVGSNAKLDIALEVCWNILFDMIQGGQMSL